ncbi:MAG TPA: serine hydrolase, partial [Gammaproteobacteria bacterium]|nr:serine hydrolase [Gammaproteobacteria bacterium]
EHADGLYFMHTGSNIGYLTLLIGSIDGKNGAVIMINISPEWNAKDYPQFGFIKDSLKAISQHYHWK